MSIKEKNLRKSKFAKIFKKDDVIAVYHPFSQELIFGNPDLLELLNSFEKAAKVSDIFNKFDLKEEDIKVIEKLYDKEFLVDEKYNENDVIEKVRSKLPQEPDFSTLYLILTEKCNFDCKYCFVVQRMEHKPEPMGIGTAKKAIEFFVKHASNTANEHNVVFYGGEPLLNFEALEFSVEYLKKSNNFKKLNLSIVTNGSLVTEEIAKFLCDNKISVSVSLDGFKEIDNKMRIYPSGEGTFDDTIRGFKLLKNIGCNVGISCTIGIHNVDELEEITEYFINDLGVKRIGFNLMHIEESSPFHVPMDYATEKMIKAFEIAREKGVYLDPIMKHIKPFVERKLHLYDCTGCGQELTITPDGSVGPCHAFIGNQKFFKGNIYDENYDPHKDKVFREWSKRSPINMENCLDCSKISICGGGCAYNAYINKGSIWEKDPQACIHSDEILEWMIWWYMENKMENLILF